MYLWITRQNQIPMTASASQVTVLIFLVILIQESGTSNNSCSAPLGMENGDIRNSALTASSFYVPTVGSHFARLNLESNGGAWCPKEPIAPGIREWLQISLNGTHLISGIQTQGRFAKGRGQEYTEEYEIEYWRPGFGPPEAGEGRAVEGTSAGAAVAGWRKYYRSDGKSVLPGNSDTFTIVTNTLFPPLIAQKIRVLPYSSHRRTICLRIELLGCEWKDGIRQYTIRQGDIFSSGGPAATAEKVSFQDDLYDGTGSKYDRTVRLDNNESSGGVNGRDRDRISSSNSNDVLFSERVDTESELEQISASNYEEGSEGESMSSQTTTQPSVIKVNSESEGDKEELLLSGGLGQLTDKVEPKSSSQFSDSSSNNNGNGWVGWKRKPTLSVSSGSSKKLQEDYIEIIVGFDQIRKFSSLNILTVNNFMYNDKRIVESCTFNRANVYFSVGGVHFSNGKSFQITTRNPRIDEAYNVSLGLDEKVARFLKVHLYFGSSSWILIGELYFHSEIYDGNYTLAAALEELELDSTQMDFPKEVESSLTVRDLNSSTSLETIIGIISGLLLITFVIGAIVGGSFWMKKSGRGASCSFHLSSLRPSFLRNGRLTLWRSSVPRHIVTTQSTQLQYDRHRAAITKDMLLTLSPLGNGQLGLDGLAATGGGSASMVTATAIVGGGGGIEQSHVLQGSGYSVIGSNGNNGTSKGTTRLLPPLHSQGSHYDNYGSTIQRSSCSGNASGNNYAYIDNPAGDGIGSLSSEFLVQPKGSSSGSQSGSPLINIRANKLAAKDYYDAAAAEEDAGMEAEAELEDSEVEDETSTTNNTTTTTSNNSSSSAKTHQTYNRKMKVALSSWNIINSKGRTYRHRTRVSIPQVPFNQLRLLENLGNCSFGQVHLYDLEEETANVLYGSSTKTKSSRTNTSASPRHCRFIAKTIKTMSEIRLLSLLDHENIFELISICIIGSDKLNRSFLGLYAAPACGDLCSFLSNLTNTPSLSWLLNVGAQIASGMNYLECLSLTHQDLAARNCLVEREGSIRIADLAMACEQYHGDYFYNTSKGRLIPLRWWSWESILMDDFTMKSSIWSFGVTLWEVLTLCRQKPLAHVPDHLIPTLAEKYGSTATDQELWLPQPLLSPPEIFDLMRECWRTNPKERPSFQHIHLFLEQKCKSTLYQHHQLV